MIAESEGKEKKKEGGVIGDEKGRRRRVKRSCTKRVDYVLKN